MGTFRGSAATFVAVTLALLLASPAARAQTGGAQPPAAQGDQTPATPPAATPAARETSCAGRVDEDGDGLVDCADSDCFRDPVCQAGGAGENTNERCSDWIDNDADGMIDCDDQDCMGPGVTRCRGSWQSSGASQASGNPSVAAGANEELPELGRNQTVEDLIGTHGDRDGERTDEVCADGIDNDGDGRTDCADFGCRFDPSVTVCSGTPSLRFSAVVGGALLNVVRTELGNGTLPADQFDARFTRIQLRALGPIPLIQNSFFLINIRAERQLRLSFAMFQVPLARRWYVNINSGGGSLSTSLITSRGAAAPARPGVLRLQRLRAGQRHRRRGGRPHRRQQPHELPRVRRGGLGRDQRQRGRALLSRGQRELHLHRRRAARAEHHRLLRALRLALSVHPRAPHPRAAGRRQVGPARRRALHRLERLRRPPLEPLLALVEHYGKQELEFDSTSVSFVTQLGVLIIPRRLLFGADFGGFFPGLPGRAVTYTSALPRPLQELQWRVALHLYWYRNVGVLSALYRDRTIERNPDRPADVTREQEFSLEAQFRF
jgi:hypothetical protein